MQRDAGEARRIGCRLKFGGGRLWMAGSVVVWYVRPHVAADSGTGGITYVRPCSTRGHALRSHSPH